ncbi:MAG: hypothetical protein BWY52_03338 [Chloroflexi bacterium ADurb.Bin325]|nr:MAG: hypothetical protein BWY52_03338 [Chloroflexi bacterium ADurb.Bin325]
MLGGRRAERQVVQHLEALHARTQRIRAQRRQRQGDLPVGNVLRPRDDLDPADADARDIPAQLRPADEQAAGSDDGPARGLGRDHLRDERAAERDRVDGVIAHGQRGLRRALVRLDQHDRRLIGHRERVGRLEEDRPELRQLLQVEAQRRKAHGLDLIGQVGADQEVIGVGRVLRIAEEGADQVAREQRAQLQRGDRGREQPLRLELSLVPVERQEVVQIQPGLRALRQPAVRATQRQVGVAPGRVGHDVVQIQVDPRLRRQAGRRIGPAGRDPRIRDRAAQGRQQQLREPCRNSGNRQIVAHQAPPRPRFR